MDQGDPLLGRVRLRVHRDDKGMLTRSTMSEDIEVKCRCGAIHGWVRGVSAQTVNRAVCYCDDCQAFLHYLDRADLFEPHGGTDIVQVAPASLAFDRGTEKIAGMRLGPKGLNRWFASCCKTPIGNAMTPALPFVGLGREAFGELDAARRDALFGKAWALMGKYAVGEPPAGSTDVSWRGVAHAVRLVLGWKIRGRGWPHPFFERDTKAIRYPITVLSKEERDALRPLCGPHPIRTARA